MKDWNAPRRPAETDGDGITLVVRESLLALENALRQVLSKTEPGQTITVTLTFASGAKIVSDDTTDSTSTITGAIQTDGGLGVAKRINAGGKISANSAPTHATPPGLEVASANQPSADVTTANFYDTTAQAANVGGGVGFGFKYTDAGAYLVTAAVTAYKVNGTTGNYATGLKLWVTANGQAALQSLALTISDLLVAAFAGRLTTDDTTEATTTTDGSLQTDGGLSVVKKAVVGTGLKLATGLVEMISTGSAPTCGTLTLGVGGTRVVSTTAILTGDLVVMQRVATGGTFGMALTYTIINATSFTATSDNALDTSTYNWHIIRPF